jgi:hypothetical protein
MKRRTIAFAAVILLSGALSLMAVSPEESRSAAEKLDRITLDEMAPGERITLTQSEINSFLAYDYAGLIPEGIRDLRVEFAADIGIVSGRADFSQLAAAQDPATRLLLTMLRGERQFMARVRYVSSGGQARADVDSFQIDGLELKGPILDWIVQNYVATDIEGFALGQPTPLGHNLEQILLQTGQAVVVAGATRAQLQPVYEIEHRHEQRIVSDQTQIAAGQP